MGLLQEPREVFIFLGNQWPQPKYPIAFPSTHWNITPQVAHLIALMFQESQKGTPFTWKTVWSTWYQNTSSATAFIHQVPAHRCAMLHLSQLSNATLAYKEQKKAGAVNRGFKSIRWSGGAVIYSQRTTYISDKIQSRFVFNTLKMGTTWTQWCLKSHLSDVCF